MNRYLLALILVWTCVGVWADYSENADAQALIDELVEEAGLSRTGLERLIAEASYQQSIVDAMDRPAERVLSWGEYRDIFLRDNRIDGGVAFWEANAGVLAEAEAEFGVPAETIVAIIGVETLYGRITGSYRVIDALATLAFDYPARASFFRSELKHFLTFSADHQRDPLDYTGSYAGAMGYGQFMPSSYRNYARDYTGDGFADLWESQSDAIWSVANYLKAHGWRPGKPVAVRAEPGTSMDASLVSDELRPHLHLSAVREAGFTADADLPDDRVILLRMEGDAGAEYWLGFHNFYVITRYNISALYALAVFQLGESIAARHLETAVQ